MSIVKTWSNSRTTPLHSTQLQINSQSIPRLDPIDSKSSSVFSWSGQRAGQGWPRQQWATRDDSSQCHYLKIQAGLAPLICSIMHPPIPRYHLPPGGENGNCGGSFMAGVFHTTLCSQINSSRQGLISAMATYNKHKTDHQLPVKQTLKSSTRIFLKNGLHIHFTWRNETLQHLKQQTLE